MFIYGRHESRATFLKTFASYLKKNEKNKNSVDSFENNIF